MARRDIVVALIATSVTLCAAVAAHMQTPTMQSSTFDWNAISARQTNVGAVRQFFRSPTATLDELECHVTTLNPGETSHAPHKHPNEELVIVKEGLVEALSNGEMKRVGTGSVIFNASNQLHSIRNVGDTAATYHVINWSSPGMLRKSQQSAEPETPPVPSVSIPNSQIRTLKSLATGRAYDIYVRLPAEHGMDNGKKYPVLYVLDGQWDFKLLDSVYGGLRYDKFVPAMIIVGITYSGPGPNYDVLRAMDYTPAPVGSHPGSGDAPKFLEFLKKELLPFIETNYRADTSRRVLMGSSLGGLFTLYTMFAEPDLFSAYVSASPAVRYGDRFAFKQEAEYASKQRNLPVRLFLSVGEVEDLAPPVKEFIRILSGRGYKGLKMETRVIEGERHAGNKPEAFNRGLRFVFRSE